MQRYRMLKERAQSELCRGSQQQNPPFIPPLFVEGEDFPFLHFVGEMQRGYPIFSLFNSLHTRATFSGLARLIGMEGKKHGHKA